MALEAETLDERLVAALPFGLRPAIWRRAFDMQQHGAQLQQDAQLHASRSFARLKLNLWTCRRLLDTEMNIYARHVVVTRLFAAPRRTQLRVDVERFCLLALQSIFLHESLYDIDGRIRRDAFEGAERRHVHAHDHSEGEGAHLKKFPRRHPL